MKKKKGLLKRTGALALALALSLTMGQPLLSYAQDDTAVAAEEEQVVPKGEEAPPEEGMAGQGVTSGEEQKEDAAKVQPDAEEAGKEEAVDNKAAEGNAAAKDKNAAEENTAETDKKEAGNQADITKPVIREVKLKQQGKTLKEGDTVKLYIDAYDLDSGIKSVQARLTIGGRVWEEFDINYDETEKCYVGTYQLKNVGNAVGYVYDLRVVDNNANYSEVPLYENNEQDKPLYWFKTEREKKEYKVTEFQFSGKDQEIEENDLRQGQMMSVKTDIPVDAPAIIVNFSAEDTSYISFKLEKNEEEDGFSYAYIDSWYNYDNKECTRTYKIDSVYAEYLGEIQEMLIEKGVDCQFTVIYKNDEGGNTESKSPIITSIEMDKKGELVKAGDKIGITVKVTDDGKINRTGNVTMSPAADIATGYETVELTYQEQDDVFYGIFEITGDTYPCEWYIDSINIADDEWNFTNVDFDFPNFRNTLPYYVNVYTGNTFADETRNMSVSVMTVTEQASWLSSLYVNKENMPRRTSLKDMGISLPAMESKIKGLEQTGWVDNDGNEITEDTIFLNKGYITVYARYDKIPLALSFSYITTEGKWMNLQEVELVNRGTTYKELLQSKLDKRPENMAQEVPFEKWDYTYYSGVEEDAAIPEGHGSNYINFTAKYSGKRALVVTMYYYDENGLYRHEGESGMIEYIDENKSAKEVIQMLKSRPEPKLYEGLRFKEWDIGLSEDTELKSIVSVSMHADCENHIIRYMIDPEFENAYYCPEKDIDTIVCQVAEHGEKVSIPKSVDGYEKVVWTYRDAETDTFEVTRDMEFYGYGTKTSDPDQPDTPDTPDQPDTPDNPDTPDAPENPDAGIQLPEDTVNSVVDAVKTVETGETVTVNMGSATVVPAQVLAAAKGKDVDVKLVMGDYTWTINGKDVAASNLKDINLEVNTDANAIPGKVVKELAGDNPTRQLSLTHNGDFGFKATLTVNLGSEYAGKYGNLYYHDSDGKMVFRNAGKIHADGSVDLTFSHASDYIVVISDKKMSQADVPGNLKPDQTGSDKKDNIQKKPGAVKTGDTMAVMPFILMLVGAAGIIVVCGVRIKKRR